MSTKKLSLVLIIIFFNFFIFPTTVRVGFFEFPGFQEFDGIAYSGFGYEYLKEIQTYTDWVYDFITEVPILDANGNPTNKMEAISYGRALQMLEKGELDIVGTVRKQADRESKFLFPHISSGKVYETLTTRKDYVAKEKGETIRFGLRAGSEQLEYFLNHIANHYSDPTAYYFYDTYKDLTNALHNKKEIDYIISTSLRKFDNEILLQKYNVQEHYFAINPNRLDLLLDFNMAQSELFFQMPTFGDMIYERNYLSQRESSVSLSQSERNFIKQNPVVQVAHEIDWIPIDYEDKDGNPIGITPSILDIISKKIGIRFEYISFSNYIETFSLLKDKNNIILASFMHDYGWAEKRKVKMTPSLFSLPVSIVTLKHYDDIHDDALTFVGIEGYFLTEKYVLGHTKYLIVSNVEECVDAVREKKADIAFMPTYSAERFLQNPKNAKLHYHSLADIQYEISLALDENCDPLLFSIINKAVNSLTPYEINQSIYDNTLYLKEPDTFQTFFYKNFFLIIILLFIIFIFIISLIYFVNLNKRRMKANIELSLKNRELQKAFSYAEQANSAKTDFLSRVSHEIRTPIHIITGMTDLSYDKVNDQNFIVDALKKISSASDYLLSLVNDVLDMSRIERGKTVINNDNFYLNSVFDTVANLFDEKIKNKGLRLQILTQGIENNYVYGDKEHIEQVLINLLDNALKYTDKGKIELSLYEEKRASAFSLFTFIVKDTGQGIDTDRLRSIWEPFEKGKSKLKTKGSFGLGLSIVKSLVHLMGGTVQVESTLGKGSSFMFSVPLKIIKEGNEKRRKTDNLRHLEYMYHKEKILVVEDNELNADIVRMMLEKKNLTVEIVGNGQEAFDILLEKEAGYYSLVLMDIRMPIMDGREATKLIRNSQREDLKTLPIIAMSADAFTEEIKIAQSFGMNEYLTKPVRSESLYLMIYKFLLEDRKV